VALSPGEWTAIAFLLFGLVLLVLEVLQPGFFIAVPGGALLLGGALGLAFPGLMFGSAWAWLLWPILLGIATVVNIRLYKRWAPPGEKPLTLSRDSIAGELATVTVTLVPGRLSGKVLVKGQTWSARPDGPEPIPEGTRVRVLRSEGVHLIVEPAETAA